MLTSRGYARAVALAATLMLVTSACGNSQPTSGTRQTVPDTPTPTAKPTVSPQGEPVVLAVTAGDPSARHPVSIRVGTLVRIHLLGGSHQVGNWQAPSVADESVLAAYPLGTDTVTNGLASNYLAVQRGHTTISVEIATTAVVYDVSVT
jgi:hypothetical protein